MPLKSDKCKSEGEIGRLHLEARKLRRLKAGGGTVLGIKVVSRLPEFFKQVEAEVESVSRDKIHQTCGPLFCPPLYMESSRPGVKG